MSILLCLTVLAYRTARTSYPNPLAECPKLRRLESLLAGMGVSLAPLISEVRTLADQPEEKIGFHPADETADR